jgi:prophage antirepressor-like protein
MLTRQDDKTSCLGRQANLHFFSLARPVRKRRWVVATITVLVSIRNDGPAWKVYDELPDRDNPLALVWRQSPHLASWKEGDKDNGERNLIDPAQVIESVAEVSFQELNIFIVVRVDRRERF